MTSGIEKSMSRYTTIDVAAMAILGIIFGLANAAFGWMYTLGCAAFGPIGGALVGPFVLAPMLAIYIIRKPGAAVITYIINGMTQWLTGNPFGVICVVFAILGGLTIEAVYAVGRYRQWSMIFAFIAGGTGYAATNHPVYFLFGWRALPLEALIIPGFVAVIGGGIMSGLVAVAIGRAMLKAGVLSPFRIAKWTEPSKYTLGYAAAHLLIILWWAALGYVVWHAIMPMPI